MKISITSKHFKLSNKLRSTIEKEFEKFEKYTERIFSGEMIIEENSHRKLVEIKMKIDRSLITAEAEDYDLLKAIEKGFARMESRVKKHIGKYHRRRKG